jgi:predicted RNase H-like nuclease (RuvC/YqgF family)
MSTDRTTELLNYLSAMSHDVGELRKEMRTGFSGVRKEVDEMRTEMRTGFGEVRKEVRALANRFNRLEAKVLDTYADVDDLEGRVATLEGKKD